MQPLPLRLLSKKLKESGCAGGWIFGTESQPAGFRTIRIDAFDQYVIQHSAGDDIIKRYNRSFEWTNDANKSLVYPRDKASNPCIYYPEWASAVTLGIWWSRASVFLGEQVCSTSLVC